jgi:hypothetical protein
MMKMKTNKKIAGAAAMLLLSATMLGTSTFAWFTMNKEVTVTGMKLKATASEGLVISGDYKTNWKTDWDVAMTQGVSLYPTSTNGTAANPAWAVAYSKVFDDAYKNQTQSGAEGYTDLSMNYTTSGTDGDTFTAALAEGIGYAVKGSGTSDTQNYVLKKTFFIKSTADAPLQQALIVKDVTADVAVRGSGTQDLNKALRVLVVVNGTDSYIYAPIASHDSGTKFKGTTSLTLIDSGTPKTTSINPIGNTNDTAVQVDMYMYFEGEDENCKSSNITAIDVDTLEVSAAFTYTNA